MKKILIIAVFLAEFSVAFAGNPLMVIRCRPNLSSSAKDAAAVVVTPPEAECYGGQLKITTNDEPCNNTSGNIDTIKITLNKANGDAWVPNDDAVTIRELNNCRILNAQSVLISTINQNTTDDRAAFVADANGVVEIQFVRIDPTASSEIVFRNATLETGGSSLPFVACPAVGAVVPTMGEWGIIALTILILTLGIVALKQKKQTLIPIKERVK